jgi:anti-sigma factor RsiW
MNCRSVESRLSAYLDGELTGQEMFCLRDHLSRCLACREEAASLKGLKRLIGCMECPEPDHGFEERLTAAVMATRKPKPSLPAATSVVLFAGVAGATMIVTLQLIGALVSPTIQATRPDPNSSTTGIDFEVNRDAMTSAISDPISGSSVWSAADSR